MLYYNKTCNKERIDKMKKKQFKAESKKLLDMMINSIYTNKEIFLRELISNASDAIDKLYYKSLTDTSMKIKKEDLQIRLIPDKENRTLTIMDNGIGMTQEELEENLGTIAKSGSALFKEGNDKAKDISIIGQFGVGFYSAFMVSNKVEVTSKSYESDKAYTWISTGADGYEIKEAKDAKNGTTIKLYIKENTEEEHYDEFLEEHTLSNLIKKYSDYIHYPIKMEVVEKEYDKDGKEAKETKVDQTLNSMMPIWKKAKKEVKEEEYYDFYADKFYDYEKPIRVIRSEVEGRVSYQTLLFIPSHAPFDYYSKDYEKGLQLYSKGVLIMDKCSDLLPDYFSFVKGIVDSEDISLNISRETLQENHQIASIAKSLETKIKKELETMLQENREDYEKFYSGFGTQLKYGIYSTYGMKKDLLQDLLLFYSSSKKKLVTLKEYVENMKEGQDTIYYACGETTAKIDLLPRCETVKEKGYEILYLTDYVDEFVLKMMMTYEEKKFMNVADEELDLTTEEEKESLKEKNEQAKDMFESMKKCLNTAVQEIRYTNKLKEHPVCLTSKGNLSIEMEKVLNTMPTGEKVKAELVLEINQNHPIASKLEKLYQEKDEKTLEEYTKVLYAEARLIEGMPIDNPTEISGLICNLLAK